MDIRTAILSRTDAEHCITRQSWVNQMGSEAAPRIDPTNTPDCCLISSPYARKARGWQPTLEDLTAADWITTGE